MHRCRLLGVAAVTGVLVMVPSAHAKTITLSGTVKGAAGYTVSASAKTGSGRSVKLTARGRFALKVAGTQASLSLIRPDGKYYGPVVLDHVKRGRVHLAAKRSAKLGSIRLAGGYAVVRHALPGRSLASSYARTDRRGKPVGAGRLGLRAAAAKPHTTASAALQQPPGPKPPQNGLDLGADPDSDGLTNAYDLDDDNDAVLDISDPDEGNPNNLPARVFTNLWAELPDTLNANLGNLTDAAIDATLAKDLSAAFTATPWLFLAGQQVSAVDVNCFAISWCAPRTGSALIPEFAYGPQGPQPGEPGPGSRFVAFDTNGDGLPNLPRDPRMADQQGYNLVVEPATGRAGLDPAATVNFRFTTDRGQTEYATTFGPSFVTTPAVVSLNGRAISYPVGPNDPGVGQGADNQNHSIELSSPQVTVTLYRPQRPAIPGAEDAGYYDMGHLRYEVANPTSETGAACPATSFSNLSPTLTTVAQGPDQGVVDNAADQLANPANTISFTIDLAQCVGQPIADRGFPFSVVARTARGENAGTKLYARVIG